MKKSIFLFFAAILCAIGMNAATPEKLYLTPNSNWKQSNARFAAYFFGNGEKWVSMTKVTGETNLYEVTAPAGYPKVIFCRMNPGAAANNWDNKWNQTADLTIPTDGKNHFTISGSGWDNFTTTWSIWPVPAVKTYKDIVFTITANEAPTLSWKNAGDKLADGSVAMEATGNANEYTYTLQEVDELAGVDYTLAVGTIKTTEKNTTVNVTADFKDLLPQVVVMGVVDWNGNKMTVADDYLSASVTLTLAGSKTLALKLTIDGDWMGDTKNAITKDKNSSIFNSNGNNGSIITDLSGEYVFTYTYANKTLTVTYPTEVVEVKETYYIVGTKNLIGGTEDWQIAAQKEMTDENEDKIFEYTFENLAAATYEFKINNNKDAWGNAKGFDALDKNYEGVTAGNDNNIKLTLSEAAANPIVVKYNSVDEKISFEGLTEKAPEPTFDYYVIGTVNEWGLKDAAYGMTDENADGVYEKEVTLAIGTHELKVNNGTWSDGYHWGFGDLAVAYEETADKGGNIMITVAAEKTITVKFDKNTKKITLDGLTVKTNVVTYDYYIVGSMNSWNQNSEDYGMSDEDEDGIYEKTLTLKNNDEFKVKGTAWYGFDAIEGTYKETSSVGDKNIKVTFATDTEVTVKFNSETKKITFEGLTVIEDYYTVVGVAELFGTAWDRANDANKMEKQGDGSYKLIKENVTLAAIGYDWKIAKNGNWWDDAAIGVNPSEGNNTLTITTAGRYNVTFTLAADLKSATVETELLEAAVVIPDCFISGNKNLTGEETEWQGNEFTMVYNEETETWSYTLAGLQPEKEYALKVVCGGTWKSYADLTSVPAGVTQGNDDAIAFKMAEAGDVTVTYNVEAGITISGNFYVAPTYAYYIAGNMNGWDKASADYGMTDENADGIYEKEITLAAGQDHQFKVTNGKWGNEEGGFDCATVEGAYEEVDSKDGNVLVKLNAETTFTVIFDGSKITFDGLTEIVATELVYKVTVPAGTPNCYIVFGDAWDAENAPAMTKVDDTHYTYTRTGLKSDEYKYLYGQSWDFVEVRADNRTWAEEDVVENWNNPYTEVRTGLTAGNYYTICMPKEMTNVQGATLWSFCGKDANFAYLVQADAPYTAGKAYIMYAEAETVSAILTGDEVLAPVANGAIYGTFADMDQTALDAAATAAGSDIYLVIGNLLRLVNGQTNNSLPANRAYVVIDEIPVGEPAGIPANRVRSMPMQPQVATGMENVDASAQPVKMIIDGQLYILRGEKMYDAQGKLVK